MFLPENIKIHRRAEDASTSCVLEGNENCRPLGFIGDESRYSSTCCSAGNKCGLGDGGCISDEDCIGTLVCGSNNCGISGRDDTRCCATSWEEPGSY